jgi:uncharacterized protein (TIGR00369 family)
MEMRIDERCFVCGVENESGLRLRFDAEGGRARTECVIAETHQGYAGVSHGGIVAALLDEVMVYAAVSLGHWAATAELTVRYHRPVPTGAPLAVTGEVTSHRRRLVECRAEMRSAADELLASATAKLVQGPAVQKTGGPE